MFRFIFASSNRGKLEEVKEICQALGVAQVLSPNELVTTLGIPPEVEEGKDSYLENAKLKAQAFFNWSRTLQLPVIADDTGLEVLALGDRPGVCSARYAGETASMAENKAKLLNELSGIEDRRAVFRCILWAIIPAANTLPLELPLSTELSFGAEGLMKGSILTQEIGSGGFGYDSLVEVAGTNQTLASLKQGTFLFTHRYQAFKNLFTDLHLISNES